MLEEACSEIPEGGKKPSFWYCLTFSDQGDELREPKCMMHVFKNPQLENDAEG